MSRVQKRNEVEIRIYAAQRSGHHGVIAWILGHFNGDVLHLNNVSHESRDENAYGPGTSDFRDCYLLNVENADLETAPAKIEGNAWDTYAGPSRQVRDMLVLRDPYNCLASHIKLFGHWMTPEKLAIWKQHALEYLGRTTYLPKDTIKVSYNSWFMDQRYREAVSASLGLSFSDRGLGVEGNSPSFRTKFESSVGDARELAVLDRWRTFSGDPEYIKLFGGEIGTLAEEIFGTFARAIALSLMG